jgi:hypothetical protein
VVQELRPRGVGEVLDVAVTLYRARFWLLMRIALVPVIPVYALAVVILLSATPESVTIANDNDRITFFVSDDGSTSALVAGVVTVLVVWALASSFVIAASTRIVADAYVDSDRPRDGKAPARAIRDTFRRILPLVGLTIVGAIGLGISFVLCYLPALFLGALWAVCVPVMVLEGTGVFRSLGRSGELTRARYGLALGVVVVALLLVLVLNQGLSSLLTLVLPNGDGAASGVIAQSTANAVSSVLTTPFIATAFVALYFDLRIRHEAFDVQMMIARLDATQPADSIRA